MPLPPESSDVTPRQEAPLAPVVVRLLSARKLTLAVAESCTGGLLSGALTETPGSSECFLGGVISYSDSLKLGLLGVPAETIRQHGAVSAECALQMAEGVLRVTDANLGVAITGVAGPGGGTPGKPVGTTYIAIAGPGAHATQHFLWTGNREENRRQSVQAALEMVIRHMTSDK